MLNLLTSFKLINSDNFDFEVINPNSTNDEKEKTKLFEQLIKSGLNPTDIEVRSSSKRSNNCKINPEKSEV